jgi:dephospho-CoA kinase
LLTIGLTGGLACGKSTVARGLEEKGCALVTADLLGHEAIAPGGRAHAAVLAEFGQDLGDAGGQIDRRRLAERVFDQPDRVQKLNELVHPHIRRRIREHIDSFRRAHPDGILVVEAALLLEAFADPAIDKIVVIDCTEEQQVARFGQKGGTAEEARRRMAVQMPRAERLARADYVIDASGSIDETLRQVDRLYEQLRNLKQRPG